MSTDEADALSRLMKAVADPVRLRLLSLIATSPDASACVCDLVDAFDLSQPTISHHLKTLHDVGILDREKRGAWVHYSVQHDTIETLAVAFTSLSTPSAPPQT